MFFYSHVQVILKKTTESGYIRILYFYKNNSKIIINSKKENIDIDYKV